MHIPCPPPSRSRRPTAQKKASVRQWHEQIEKKIKQVVIIYPTLLHTSNYRKHKQSRGTVEAMRSRRKEAVMCLEVDKTMGGVIQAAPRLQMRQFGRFLDSSLRVVRR